MGKFGISSPAPEATPTPTPSAGKFGLSGQAAPTPTVLFPEQYEQDAYQSGLQKLKAGQNLSKQEADAVARMQGGAQMLDKVGVALQPLQALSAVTRGLIGQAQGRSSAPAVRGLKAAAGDLTYGLAEHLPGMTGARANGVSGAELLQGTKYANNPMAAMAVEVLADPSILLTAGGAILKAGATAGRLATLDRFASTAEGAATIRGALAAADSKGSTLIHAGDEITGVPAAVRAAQKGVDFKIPLTNIRVKANPVQTAKAGLSKLGDTQLPNWVPGANAIRREGGGTLGDAFGTQDFKNSVYTPEQLARDSFRNDTKLGISELGQGIKAAAVPDAKIATNLLKGLSPADAAEANRLLGVFTTTSKPELAQEALRQLTALSTRAGRDLEPAFVDAVKATDRVGQVTLGQHLEAQGLPVVMNPAVTKGIQDAQSGADLVGQIGKYTTQDGRPRGILMTNYSGRSDPASVIQKLIDGPEIPANVAVDEAQLGKSLQASTEDLPLPPKPVEPGGTPPAQAELPMNDTETARGMTHEDVNVSDPASTPKLAEARPEGEPTKVYSPQEVLDNLFTGGGEKSDLTFPVAEHAAEDVATTEQAAADPPEVGQAPSDVIDNLVSPTIDHAGIEADANQRYGEWQTDPRAFEYGSDARVGISEYLDAHPELNDQYAHGIRTTGASPTEQLTNLLDNGFDQSRTVHSVQVGDRAGFGASGAAHYASDGSPYVLLGHDPTFAGGVDTVLVSHQYRDAIPKLQKAYPHVNFVDAMEGTAYTAEDAAHTAPVNTAAPAADLRTMQKTPQDVLESVLNPEPHDPLILPSPAITRTPQSVSRDVALPAAAENADRMVTKSVPTTYRTVPIDANALDWGALADNASRRSVLNSIEGAGNARFVRDSSGALRLDRSDITVPLDHPVISHYFTNEEIMAAQRTHTEIGERTITRKESVPHWYDPKDPAPMDIQRAQHEQAQQEAAESAYPNDLEHVQAMHDQQDDTAWRIGDAYASFDRPAKPRGLSNTQGAVNDYAARVKAFTGSAPTKGDLFQYQRALARYRQAAALKNMDVGAVAAHFKDFYAEHPDATLFEGVVNAAREFDLGRGGIKHLQNVLRQSESGFERQLSTLEKKEFAQYLMGRDAAKRGEPGGLIVNRLVRNPQSVSEEFQQVFPQDLNALKLLDEQVRTRTAAIVRAERFRQYRDYLDQTGQIITQKKLKELRMTSESRLTPDQLEMRRNAANAITRGGSRAGWKVMDRNIEGYFQKGDIVPWWAHFDLFGAGHIEDAAVSASTLGRGGLDVYNRLWSSMNAQMLGSITSVVNDQIGQFLQMAMWGVTPDAVIEGIIRRATATPEQMAAMRESGIQSAKLESDLGADSHALTRLAQRLDTDTDMSRMERVIDAVLRFRERGTGLNPQAMTGAAGVAADVAHMGAGYLFQFRSAVADLQREALYFHRTALGDTPTQAAAHANNVMLDMRLVPAYARVIRKFWPFFNWTAMSAPRSIVTVLRKPGLAAAYHRLGQGSSNPNDPQENARRVLARDGGYINLGLDERNGTRLYLDPRNWDPTNTIPQLLDFSGTKVGSVGLPWYANLLWTVQNGQDRFGRNIYSNILSGGNGGFVEAYAADPKGTLKAAAGAMYQQFNPSYAPGSPRAQAFVRSVLATAQLPPDGSKDITLAHSLANSPQGRAFLVYLQNGALTAIDRDLLGTRKSPYTAPAPSMARAAAGFFLPLRGINGDHHKQGDAMQALSVGKLELQSWVSQQKKELQQLHEAGASRPQLRAKQAEIKQEYRRKAADLKTLNTVTR